MTRKARTLAVSREIGTFAIFAGLAVVMTWPLAAHLDRAVQEPSDPFCTTWAMEWGYHATFSRGVSLFDANIFYPSKAPLAFSEHMYGLALPFFPLFLFDIPPLTIHNIALILGFAFSGYAAYALCFFVTGRRDAAFTGGIAYAFIGFRFHHLTHLHFVWSGWLALVLLAMLAFARRPTVFRAVLLSGAVVMNGLTSMHWFVFGTLALAISAVLIAVASGQTRSWTYWRGLLLAGAISLVVLWPFIQPYREVAELYGMERNYRETITNSAYWRDWLAPNLQNRLYSKWSPGAAIGHERTLFPGFVILLLAAVALLYTRSSDFPGGDTIVRDPPTSRRSLVIALDILIGTSLVAAILGAMMGYVNLGVVAYGGSSVALLIGLIAMAFRLTIQRPRSPFTLPLGVWIAFTWVVIGLLGARGLRGWFHSLLFDRLSAFRGIRMPVRWSMIAYTGLAVLVAVGMLALLRGRSRASRLAITMLVAAVMLFELRAAPIRWYLMPLDPRPVYEWVARTPFAGGIVEFPMDTQLEFEYLWRSTGHHKPLLNGTSSYTPEHHRRLLSLYNSDPIPEAFGDLLEQRRCSIIIVHAGGLAQRPAVRDWLKANVESGRLMFLKRFDAGSKGDYVFALTRVEPRADRWRSPDVPDRAGRTPSDNLEIFVRDGWTYSDTTFGQLNIAPMGTIRGRLVVLGWAVSPAGVDHVKIHFGNHCVFRLAELGPRPEVQSVLPYYPEPDRVGFSVELPGPPRGLSGATDMQVEIVDRKGQSTFMRPSFFEWYGPLEIACVWNEERLDVLLERLGHESHRHKRLLMEGTESIRDIIDFLVGDADYETDLAFVERVVPVLIGHYDQWLINKSLRAMARGRSRERVLDDLVTSREFASQHLRAGAVTVE